MVEATQKPTVKTVDYSKFKNVLKGAKKGGVVTRFPPEPSGYLHIGHVKAAMMNYHYAKMYEGKMILRFDDTNPMTEKLEFVESFTADLKTLDITPDQVTYTSDYFEQIQEAARKLITDGKAYADDTPGEEMKEQRDAGIESKYRVVSVAENMKRFDEMLAGKTTTFCIRAKMNMQDKVGCLRDPVFYRCKAEKHHKTGDKYKAYPTYDLACPVVDSLEGVTHALRTLEYRDRNALYEWVQHNLGMTKNVIFDFAKLNLISTVLSKRKLKWFVDEGLVEGWSDPRFPTLQGILRRGMTVEALKDFMLEQGPSKNTNLMEWDKIWATNKALIDPIVPRYTAIGKDTACKLIIDNGPSPSEGRSADLHPKDKAVGTKVVIYGKNLIIERDDAKDLAEGEKVTLMKWGNATITKKEADGENFVLHANIDEEDKNFKGTKKITWISADEESTVEIQICEFDHLITKPKIEETDKIEDIANKNSKIEYKAIAEGSVRRLNKGDMIQFERRGYYFVDKPALTGNLLTVHFIPDGKTKAMSTVTHAVDAKETSKGKNAQEGGQSAKQAGAGVNAEGKISKGQAKKDAKKAAKKQGKSDGKAGKPQGKPQKEEKPKVAAFVPQPNNFVTGPFINYLERALSQSTGTFIEGAPTQVDVEAFAALNGKNPNPKTHPYTQGWFSLINKFQPHVTKNWAAGKNGLPTAETGAPKKATAAKVEADDEDEFDPFADDDDEDDIGDRLAAKAAKDDVLAKAIAAKKAKEALVIAKSLVILEVKPWGEDTDLDELAKLIIAIEQDGLQWKTGWKKEPVAYGVFKILIGCIVEDIKVSTDDLIEKIEAFEDYVQSVDIAAFNKL